MAKTTTEALQQYRSYGRLLIFGVFTVISLAVLTLVFAYFYLDGCSVTASWKFCEFSRHFGERALAVLVFGVIFAVARPERLADLFTYARKPGVPLGPLLLGGSGLLLASVPAFFVGQDASGAGLLAALFAWTGGVILACAGALRVLAPWKVWLRSFRSAGIPLLVVFAIALALPELGDLLFPLWHVDTIRDHTFTAVIWTSEQIGLQLARGTGYVVGQDSFAVEIGQSCSGVEGFVLISVFLAGYAILFRQQLSLLRVLVILPLALLLSWLLNVFRISLLIWLGVNVSPTLAVEGFHSHAGWLLFSILALGVITVIHNIPWFHLTTAAISQGKSAIPDRAPLPPLTQDWNAARILPFAVFMFSALIASTFFEHPALAYPARLALMLAVLWIFRKCLRALSWRFDAMAVAAGAVIGIGWILSAPSEGGSDLNAVLAGLSSGVFVFWVVSRALGTALVVPLIEELFFRSYLLDFLGAGKSRRRALIAVIASTAGFAALHDRWIAAGLAGLVFAWLVMRRDGQLSDAVVSHMVANAIIAVAAITLGNWEIL